MENDLSQPKEIKELPNNLVNRIAAGEVVERPSNVVKELLDNSVDSGADRIEIRFEAGGKDLIEISDNGSGIPKDQIPLALKRHATSKIRKYEDLWKLNTLGNFHHYFITVQLGAINAAMIVGFHTFAHGDKGSSSTTNTHHCRNRAFHYD